MAENKTPTVRTVYTVATGGKGHSTSEEGVDYSVAGTGQDAAGQILQFVHQDRKNRKIAVLKGFYITDSKGKETFKSAVK